MGIVVGNYKQSWGIEVLMNVVATNGWELEREERISGWFVEAMATKRGAHGVWAVVVVAEGRESWVHVSNYR
jgi:hypothetical protein